MSRQLDPTFSDPERHSIRAFDSQLRLEESLDPESPNRCLLCLTADSLDFLNGLRETATEAIEAAAPMAFGSLASLTTKQHLSEEPYAPIDRTAAPALVV